MKSHEHADPNATSTNGMYAYSDSRIKKRGWDKEGRFYQCSDGQHPSFWQSIIQTPEWDAWYEYASRHHLYDVDECQECGWMSAEHAKDFMRFVRNMFVNDYEKKENQ